MTENRGTVFEAGFERSAWVSPDRASYTHVAGAWSNTYPVTDLPKWLAFYEKMHGQTKQPRYAEDIKLLRQVEAELQRPAPVTMGSGPSRLAPAPEAISETEAALDPLDQAIADARAAGLDL